MNLGKSISKLQQWTKERVGAATKTTTPEHTKERERATDTRLEVADALLIVAQKYLATNEPKKYLGARGVGTLLPTAAIAATLARFADLVPEHDENGSSAHGSAEFAARLRAVSQAEAQLADRQTELHAALASGFVGTWEGYISEGKRFTEARRKLESRRLAYDTALAKMQKAHKESPLLEEEVRSSGHKYEEALKELDERMSYLLAFEEEGAQSLDDLVNAQLEYHEHCAEVLRELRSGVSSSAPAPSLKPASSPARQPPSSARASSFPSSASRTPSYRAPAPPSRSHSQSTLSSIAHSSQYDPVPEPPQPIAHNPVPTSTYSTPAPAPVAPAAAPISRPTPASAPASSQRLVKATYEFTGQDDTELTFAVGDIIAVVEEIDSGWWIGELNGVKGMFPVPYVEPYQAESKPVTAPAVTSNPRPAASSGVALPGLSARGSPAPMTAAASCGTCGCSDFAENVFKRGHCNNCFHKH